MNYWKKSKMYQVAKELITDIKMPNMINCEYRFYRGSEWLEFKYSDEARGIYGKTYKCYKDGSMLMIDVFEYDVHEEKNLNVLHQIYTIGNEENIEIRNERPIKKIVRSRH